MILEPTARHPGGQSTWEFTGNLVFAELFGQGVVVMDTISMSYAKVRLVQAKIASEGLALGIFVILFRECHQLGGEGAGSLLRHNKPGSLPQFPFCKHFDVDTMPTVIS